MHFILASASPRRKELLGKLGIPFEVMVSETEEDFSEKNPVLLTESLSRQKAEAVVRKMEQEQRDCGPYYVIGADTVVFARNAEGTEEILGKPADRSEAERMIMMLQGKTHTVCTGVTVIMCGGSEERTVTFSEQTKVYVAKMTDVEVSGYLDTDEPYDKAGAYGIQGIFSKFIEKIEGDYFNVVGLPVHHLYQVLKSCPFDFGS